MIKTNQIFIFLLYILLISTPVLSWGGCPKRQYDDRNLERIDRKDERAVFKEIFTQMNTSSQCITKESLLRKEIELNQLKKQHQEAMELRQEQFERYKDLAINNLNQNAKVRLRQKILKCYIDSKDFISYTSCIDSL